MSALWYSLCVMTLGRLPASARVDNRYLCENNLAIAVS